VSEAPGRRPAQESGWRPPLLEIAVTLAGIALLAGLGRHEELELHFRASKNVGVDPKEIAEVLMHVAVYAGVPAANRAFALAKTILDVPADTPPASPQTEDRS